MGMRRLVQGGTYYSWPYNSPTYLMCSGPRTRDLVEIKYKMLMLSLQSCRIQWTIKAAIQGSDSAIAAIEAGECIDTGDEGHKTSKAAISPSWLLSVFSCILNNFACFRA